MLCTQWRWAREAPQVCLLHQAMVRRVLMVSPVLLCIPQAQPFWPREVGEVHQLYPLGMLEVQTAVFLNLFLFNQHC